MSELLQYFVDRQDQMVELCKTLIHYETPTLQKTYVDQMVAFMEGQFIELGAEIERFPQETVGDMILAKWNKDAEGKPIMFLIHSDTVWPIGTTAERPAKVEDGILTGPGSVDMKAGIAIVLTTLRGLVERGELPKRPVWVLMTSDEEVGSIHSIPLIESIGQQAGLVLVMEPATKEGAMKTWRKGIATYRLHIKGRPSHAGNAPEQGINAIVEAANQILAINKLNALKNGTSVSVTVIQGGTTMNVIPEHATITIDNRFLTRLEMERVQEALNALEPTLPGAELTLEVVHQRGAMEHDAQMIASFAQIKAIGESYGLTVREDGSGGGSDGNLTASLGIPTLDGLGPQGDGLHALHEYVVVRSLPERATLLAGVVKDWQF